MGATITQGRIQETNYQGSSLGFGVRGWQSPAENALSPRPSAQHGRLLVWHGRSQG